MGGYFKGRWTKESLLSSTGGDKFTGALGQGEATFWDIKKALIPSVIGKKHARNIARIDGLPWLGIKWLSTCIAIRPGELVQIREHEDVENRYPYTPLKNR